MADLHVWEGLGPPLKPAGQGKQNYTPLLAKGLNLVPLFSDILTACFLA